MKPTVGRIVHARTPLTEEWYAAIVTSTYPEGFSATLFLPPAPFDSFEERQNPAPLVAMDYALVGEGSVWRWPPREGVEPSPDSGKKR